MIRCIDNSVLSLEIYKIKSIFLIYVYKCKITNKIKPSDY